MEKLTNIGIQKIVKKITWLHFNFSKLIIYEKYFCSKKKYALSSPAQSETVAFGNSSPALLERTEQYQNKIIMVHNLFFNHQTQCLKLSFSWETCFQWIWLRCSRGGFQNSQLQPYQTNFSTALSFVSVPKIPKTESSPNYGSLIHLNGKNMILIKPLLRIMWCSNKASAQKKI